MAKTNSASSSDVNISIPKSWLVSLMKISFEDKCKLLKSEIENNKKSIIIQKLVHTSSEQNQLILKQQQELSRFETIIKLLGDEIEEHEQTEEEQNELINVYSNIINYL
eukprot:347030_1